MKNLSRKIIEHKLADWEIVWIFAIIVDVLFELFVDGFIGSVGILILSVSYLVYWIRILIK